MATLPTVTDLEAAGAAPGLLHATDAPFLEEPPHPDDQTPVTTDAPHDNGFTAQWSAESAIGATCCEMTHYTGPGAAECDMRPCALPLGHPGKFPHQASEDGSPLPLPENAPQEAQDEPGAAQVSQAQEALERSAEGSPGRVLVIPGQGLLVTPGSYGPEYGGDGVDVTVPEVIAEPPEIPPPPPKRAGWTPQLLPGVRRPHAAAALERGWTQERLLHLHRLASKVGIYTMEVGPQAIYLGTASAGPWLAAYHEREMDEVWGALFHNESRFVAYTDGSGTSKDKPAGLGVVLLRYRPSDLGTDPLAHDRDAPPAEILEKRLVSEPCGPGTNNHAELSAVWRALTLVPDLRRPLVIRADSEYAIGCATDPTWRIKANQELVAKIRGDLSRRRDVKFEHVRGHAGNEFNEMADRLANEARTRS